MFGRNKFPFPVSSSLGFWVLIIFHVVAYLITAWVLTTKTLQAEMVEAIYDAFFEHGQDVGDIETLLTLAAEVGLEMDGLRDKLTETAVYEQFQADVQSAYQLGVSGVPFFVVNNQYAFSGAQSPETILNILQQVQEKEKQS